MHVEFWIFCCLQEYNLVYNNKNKTKYLVRESNPNSLKKFVQLQHISLPQPYPTQPTLVPQN